ncbi:MAG: DUF1559 domain-containing protein [Gemmataceae bacterium]|nr:DUF1559 domain-containing protein [Gemmataceae bacterium]
MLQTKRTAVTLLELLVVLGIIGVLMSLLLAAVQRIRNAAQRAECGNNLKQIGLALHHYHDAHKHLPAGCSYQEGRHPQPHMAWMARLLPYLEQVSLWDQAVTAFQVEKFFEKPPHLKILGTVVPTFACPSDSRTLEPAKVGALDFGLTAYQGVSGRNQVTRDGVLFLDSEVRFADISDGTSNTLAVGERPPSTPPNFGWWYAGWGQSKDGSADSVLGVRELKKTLNDAYSKCPNGPYRFIEGRIQNPCDAFHFWSTHSGGAHFLFADGSVRFVAYGADSIMPALATRSAGEQVVVPD